MTKAPAALAGAVEIRIGAGASIAAIDQAKARSERRWHQAPDIAAAVAVSISVTIIDRAADEEARTAPAMVPATVPTAPG